MAGDGGGGERGGKNAAQVSGSVSRGAFSLGGCAQTRGQLLARRGRMRRMS